MADGKGYILDTKGVFGLKEMEGKEREGFGGRKNSLFGWQNGREGIWRGGNWKNLMDIFC